MASENRNYIKQSRIGGSLARKIISIANSHGDKASDLDWDLASAGNPDGKIIGLAGNLEDVGIVAAKLRACSDPEADILNVWLDARDSKSKRRRAGALQVAAGCSSAESLVSSFKSIKAEDIPDA